MSRRRQNKATRTTANVCPTWRNGQPADACTCATHCDYCTLNDGGCCSCCGGEE